MLNPHNNPDPLAEFKDRRRTKRPRQVTHRQPQKFVNFDPEEAWVESEAERDAAAERLFDENPELDRIIIPYSGGIDIYDRLPPDRFDQVDPDWDREVA